MWEKVSFKLWFWGEITSFPLKDFFDQAEILIVGSVRPAQDPILEPQRGRGRVGGGLLGQAAFSHKKTYQMRQMCRVISVMCDI